MTSLLLDTHAMLWFFWDDPRLSEPGKTLIEDSNNRKLVSIATSGRSHQGWSRQARLGRTEPHSSPVRSSQ